nr:hypothetical protein [Tanacetum cinerariifolium]
MSTRSTSTDLIPPFSDPESVFQNHRRNLGDPSLLLDFEEINMNPNNIQGPPPAGPNIPTLDLRLLEELLQAPTDARTWLEKEPPNSITTWNDLVSKFVNQFFPPFRTTNLRNEITRFQQRFGETFTEAWDRFKDLLNKCPSHESSPLHQMDTFYNGLNQSDQDSLNSVAVSSASGSSSQNDAITALTKQVEALISSINKPIYSIQEGCETCGGPHSYFECQAAGGYTYDVYATTGNYNAGEIRKAHQEIPQGALPSNIILNPREEIKVITIRSSITLDGPSVPPPPLSSFSKEVERDPDQTIDQMFKKLHINISLAEDLALMPKYTKMLKDLLSNKEKLLEFANTPLIENCSVVLLKKLPEKHGDPRKFLILYDFPELEKCMALANLGASINLMTLSVWKKLMILKLIPTRMTLELANRYVAYPTGIVEDVFIQVGKFTFLADFVVVDYDIDPRVPLILGRPFLRTARALVDHGNELINMINFINTTCEDYFNELLKIQQSFHPFSGSTTSLSDSYPSLTSSETSDSALEEFADELAFLDPFPPRHGDDNFDPEADLRETKFLLNRDPSTNSSPKTDIDIIDPILESVKCLQDYAAIFKITRDDVADSVLWRNMGDKALEQMPKYAKFMKDLLARKGKTEETSKIVLNKRCFAVLLNKIPFKEKDPESFTIPYVMGKVGIDKALADLRASISLIPYSMYARLDLGELKPTRMCIKLANKSTQYPKGIAENVTVKIDKFIFPMDFVVLDIKEDHKIPIILGRPFLATVHAMIDVFNKKISIKVGNETITFEIEKSMKFSTTEDDECLFVDRLIIPTLFFINSIEAEKPPRKLKELLSHLKYAFFDNNQEFSVIISSLLNTQEKESLLKVLTQHKAALAWKVVDIKGISPLFCTHKILMEDNFKTIVQPQRRLNPKVQDVVKVEIVKLLDSGLIYAIFDSPWDFMEVFMDGFSIFVNSFDYCLTNLSKMLVSKQDAKPRLIRWILLLQEFTIKIKDKKGTENLAADHLSRLENPDLETLNEEAIRDSFPHEYLMAVYVKERLKTLGSLYKKVEFEVPLTRIHVVVRLCLGVTTLVMP